MSIDPVHLSRIAANNLEKVSAARLDGLAAADAQPAAGLAGPDRLELSQQASEVQAAHEALAALPEVNAEKVAALKAQIASGTYQVDADQVAAKLMGE